MQKGHCGRFTCIRFYLHSAGTDTTHLHEVAGQEGRVVWHGSITQHLPWGQPASEAMGVLTQASSLWHILQCSRR